jgi:hypothetical protein
MFLVAALDIPTREEIDDVIREAEQILSDAVLDDETHITTTRVAPPRSLPREDDSVVLPAFSIDLSRISARTTRVRWARSPPRQVPR